MEILAFLLFFFLILEFFSLISFSDEIYLELKARVIRVLGTPSSIPEITGHIKGSFTSAIKDRRGKFEVANNGTIFLDEVADMSLKAQAKVLRALEEKKIQRVGSDKNIKVNVRVIAATNKDLKKEISNGNFREDLYHRLAVILINVPRLDERKEDISLLSNHFIKNLSLEQGTELKKISEKAISLLKDYNWTGNIRELRNVIERLIILGDNPISIDDIKKYASK